MTAPLPAGAMTAAQVAELLDRPVEWVNARLGQSGYPTMQRSSDRAQWVDEADVRVWAELSEAERHRKAAPVWQMNYETGRLEARP